MIRFKLPTDTGDVEILCETAKEAREVLEMLRERKPAPRANGASVRQQSDQSPIERSKAMLRLLRDAGQHGIPGAELARKIDLPTGRALSPAFQALKNQIRPHNLVLAEVLLKGGKDKGQRLWVGGPALAKALEALEQKGGEHEEA